MQRQDYTYRQLSQEERIEIYVLVREGKSFREIGKLLNRSHTTISREILRNSNDLWWDRFEYKPLDAKKKYETRRSKSNWNHHIFVKNPIVRDRVLKRLRLKGESWWIDEVLWRIELEGWEKLCSTSTVYRWLRCVWWADEKLLRHKWFGYHKRWDKRKKWLYKDIPLITERSEGNDKRLEIWHLECDSVVSGKWWTWWLTTIVDRKSRYVRLKKISKLKWEVVYKAMIDLLMWEEVKSLTIDNGVEFSKIRRFRKFWIDIFRCKAYASYEKWTNETHNRMIRWRLIKGCDISQESDEKIAEIANKLNNKPRKILWYRTPFEEYHSIQLTYLS